MKNKYIIHLLGYPGAGKLTIAQELTTDNTYKIFDNHTINNVLFCLTDLSTTLPTFKDKYINKLYKVAFKYFKKLDIKGNIVFTNFLTNSTADKKFYKLITKFAKDTKHIYIPIILTPNEKTLLARVKNKERAKKMKLTDTTIAKQIYQYDMIILNHKHQLTIDNSNLSPLEVATIIKQHIEKICKNK